MTSSLQGPKAVGVGGRRERSSGVDWVRPSAKMRSNCDLIDTVRPDPGNELGLAHPERSGPEAIFRNSAQNLQAG